MRIRRPIADYLVYVGVRSLAAVFLCFPINANLRTARLFGRIWFHLIPRHRRRAEQHLRDSFGSTMSARQIRQAALRSMQQMVMMAMEVMFAPRLISEWTWARYVRVGDMSKGLPYLLQRKPAIMVTGHYGNWELLGYMLAAVGLELVAVMRPLDNPHLNDYLVRTLEKAGLDLLYKKGMTRSADDVLESNKILCFIADQDAGRKGLFVDFFGRKASTYKSIGLLAIRHKVPIAVGYARRLGPDFEYEIHVNRVIWPHEWRDREDELEWITQEYTRAIEQFVREDPDQYLWIHRRWKHRPPERNRKDGGGVGSANTSGSAAAGQHARLGAGDA
jgi:KDO2-lipid IV(A) lauroyltransferase